MFHFISRVALPTMIVCSSLLVSARVDAAPWIFQPSYSSPAPMYAQPGLTIDPRVVGGPYYTQPQGAYLRGSFRLNRTMVNVRGRTVDQTWNWESWVQGGQQY